MLAHWNLRSDMRKILTTLSAALRAIPAWRRWTYLLVAFALCLATIAAWIGDARQTQRDTISVTRLVLDARAGLVASVDILGGRLRVAYQDGKTEIATGRLPDELLVELVDRNVDIRVHQESDLDVMRVVPTLILIAISVTLIWYLLRGTSRLTVGGKYRLIRPGEMKTTFEDVAGQPEAKKDLEEIVEALKYPRRFRRVGARPPKGTLLSGPPGVGKTLLARAVAGEAGANIIVASGSQFRETFMGQGARKVRQMFALARKNAPCIVFIDEIETLGRRRGAAGAPTNVSNEEDSTLNALLVELDGFEQAEGVVLIGATNRPDMIDEALMRPGRLDRHVVLDYPDVVGRRAILRIHAKGRPLDPSVDLDKLADRLTGMSGAALARLMNEAAIAAAQRNAEAICADDIEKAYLDGLLGRAKEGRPLSEEERRIVAVHESGHALVAELYAGAKRPKQATIVPRGRSLGAVISDPGEDRRLHSMQSLKADIAVLLAGRAAESLVLGPDMITTGAADDFRQATNIALKMAGEWSMTETPVLSPMPGLSTPSAAAIEERASKLIAEIWLDVLALLKASADIHSALVERLMAKETISGEEIAEIVSKGGGRVASSDHAGLLDSETRPA